MSEHDPIERKGPGRRDYDAWKCPVHDEIQSEKKDHRKMVCGKIADVKLRAENAVQWNVYAYITSATFLIVMAVLGVMWNNMHNGQTEINGNLLIIHRRISENHTILSTNVNTVENNQIMLIQRMDDLERDLGKRINGGKN
jgi:hypothetical protein